MMPPEEENLDGPRKGDRDGGLVLLHGPKSGSTRKQGCDPFAQTQRSKLQHRRARINQQINKEMRMRAGAENLFRATSNHKVKETVALELSYVNSNLQLLKEELEELNSSVDVYQNDRYVPAMRTPSRNEAGLELLMEYYNQLHFLDSRFFPPTKPLGVFFHWYDSLTGVPSHQRALAFEKGSVLFNLGALHTQLGARQDRATLPGLAQAIDAFQRAAGAFNYLKENFSNAPSLDMSAPSLNMLVRLMVAQVQECVFEKMTLLRAQNDFLARLQLAQEAAKVRTLERRGLWGGEDFIESIRLEKTPEIVGSNPWPNPTLAPSPWHQVPLPSESELPEQEKAFMQFYVTMPEGPSLRVLLQDPEERRKLGKAHLKKAIMKHEEAMRIHGLCKILRKMDILQEVLSFAHKRSLSKYSEIDHEEDFFETGDAPDIHPKTHQKPEIKPPNFSQVKVTDLFHRLGPLSVFSAKNKWYPARRVHLRRGENGFGFTLRGDSPVLIAGVIPGGCAAVDLTAAGTAGVALALTPLSLLPKQVDKKVAGMSSGMLKSNKENSRKSLMNSKSPSTLLVWSKKSKRSKKSTYSGVPFTAVGDNEAMY
ncbi:PREDICTED: rhophilin-1 [Lepidothrix coronata]|uniref:Rhophilin-1 n=1 Tax=Lepidothrix coronata TaxID=321398 RepID=A0A6J0J1X1_9PASS|nr:PREDICTED: rhophilin-1 [Lepidothrix coronata]